MIIISSGVSLNPNTGYWIASQAFKSICCNIVFMKRLKINDKKDFQLSQIRLVGIKQYSGSLGCEVASDAKGPSSIPTHHT